MRPNLSLTTRLTAFFLAALAMVLAGFTATLFLLARFDLHRQADERLESTLGTLVAAIEFHESSLEWEPNERLVTPGRGAEAEHVRWLVRDANGTLVARSRNLDSGELLSQLPIGDALPAGPARIREGGHPWRVIQRRLEAPAPSTSGEPSPPNYRGLVLTAGLDENPIDATLRTLLRCSIAVSLALWSMAALLGRFLCRRALAPLAGMAVAARSMRAGELEPRLPVPESRDELHDLGDAFNGLLWRLHEALERQRRFTGDASHQLRTPLAVMLGQVEVALRRDRTPEEYRRVLSLVHDQGTHLGQLVEMLLFLARADAEAELPDLEALDLAAWTATQEERWADLPRAGDLRILPEGGPHVVRVHPPLLAQLLDNLIDNACKYSAPGTPIIVAVGREAGQVALSVEDRGGGIDVDDLPHIFAPFFRSPRARRDGRHGLGLGLSVAQRIAASFHGTLVVRSEPGRGSRFVLLLPEVDATAIPPDDTHALVVGSTLD